jgi:hypothetical protein
VRGTGTRREFGEPIVIEPTHIKRVPHRTVPEGRGPRLSRQVKADLRYGPGCLSPHKRHTKLAATSRAGLCLRPPLHTRNPRHSDWSHYHRLMRSSPLAERRRPGPVTADEPRVQNPPLPRVPACRDSHSTRSSTTTTTATIIITVPAATTITTTTTTTTTTTNNNNNNNNHHNYCSCYFERKVGAPV